MPFITLPTLADLLEHAPFPPAPCSTTALADPSAEMADALLHAPKAAKPKPLVCPFVIAIDDRENAPYSFTGLNAGSKQSYRPLVVEKVTKRLKTGDYSIVGLESVVAIERKSLRDCLSTLAQGLDNFRSEHERMAEMVSAGGFAAVVIESELSELFRERSRYTRLSWSSIWGVYKQWPARYGVHWHFVAGRRLAERLCFELLWGRWEKREEGKQERQSGEGE